MKKKVVVLGGGTGISYLLKGLKDFPLEITAIITVADNGKSTGKLREEFLTPAVGDIRKVLSNLSTLSPEIKDVMEYRFNTYSDLDGHPIGNLLLTAFLNKTNNFKQSIEYMSKLLDVKHKVLPLSEDYLTLIAETSEKETIIGEDAIGKCGKKIENIYYQEKPHITEEVITAITEADLIIISMGSLYTSILPNIICEEVRDAIFKNKGKLMYLCNIMNQPSETTSSYVSEYLETLNKYLIKRKIDVVVASNAEISNEMLEKYEEESKAQVVIDKEKIEKMDVELIEDDLITLEDGTIKHNSLKLSAIIFAYLMR
ncbi:MAG: uridine diphosphate-N-acetylglucosamine-binding protein YvcK [Firmicutes bacterium]|nr:uridine diphosphate-N-acetylglucosamine-binding protein YvcK [Bacillota bacterium]